MRALVLKTFQSNGFSYKKDTILDIPISLFHKLSLKGLVKPYTPHIPEQKIPSLKEEFKRLFNEHAENLEAIPVTSSYIRENYPEVYKRLKELCDVLDEAFLTFNGELFAKTAREIESILWDCLNEEPYLLEQKRQEPKEVELKRACINCQGTHWLILKPKSKVSSIKCLSCGHFELHVKSNDERQGNLFLQEM